MTRLLSRPDLREPTDAGLGASVVVSGIGLIGQGLLRLGFTVLAARALGRVEYADFALALALATIATILWPASAGPAFAKFVSRAMGEGRVGDSDGSGRHLVKRTLLFLVVAAPVCGLLMWSVTGDALWALAAPLLAGGLSAQVFGRGVHMSLGMARREALTQVSAGSLALALLAVALAAGVSLGPAAAAAMLGVAFLGYGALALPAGLSSRGTPRRLVREIDGFVLVAVVGSIASAGLVPLSITFARWRLDAPIAGEYAAAVALALPLALVSSAISMVLYPRMARMVTATSLPALRLIRIRVTLALSGAAVLVLGILGSAIAPVVDLVLGRAYESAGALTLVLVLGVVLTGLATPSVTVMSTRTNRSLAVVSGGAWVGALSACVFWMLRPAAAESVAWGYVVATWITATIAVIAADRRTGDSVVVPWLCVTGGLVGAIALYAGLITSSAAIWATASACLVGALVGWLLMLRAERKARSAALIPALHGHD